MGEGHENPQVVSRTPEERTAFYAGLGLSRVSAEIRVATFGALCTISAALVVTSVFGFLGVISAEGVHARAKNSYAARKSVNPYLAEPGPEYGGPSGWSVAGLFVFGVTLYFLADGKRTKAKKLLPNSP